MQAHRPQDPRTITALIIKTSPETGQAPLPGIQLLWMLQ